MAYSDLSYQERVLLAASEISKANEGERGYEFHWAGGDLVLEPWAEIDGRGKTYFPFLRVADGMIRGEESILVNELNNMESRLRGLSEE